MFSAEIGEEIGLVILVGIFTALYVAVRRFYMPSERKKKPMENQTSVE